MARGKAIGDAEGKPQTKRYQQRHTTGRQLVQSIAHFPKIGGYKSSWLFQKHSN
jgi:hypothetical protein